MEVIVVIGLVSLSGLFSGLTLGLLGLNKADLERKIKLKDKRAKKVYQVRKDGNFLLCTLLLGNVAVNSALSIFLGSVISGILAGVLSTGLIVIFGEILPQAIFTRYALHIGAKTVWVVKIFQFILYPVAKPLAYGLDKLLGKEMNSVWSKKELEIIVSQHEDDSRSSLDEEEEKIILGALRFSDKIVDEVMTPRIGTYAFESGTVLNKKLLNEIKERGFTRIPVFVGNIDNVIGVLYAKDLIGVPAGIKVDKILRSGNLIWVKNTHKLDFVLSKFLSSKVKTHIAFVTNKFKELVGVISLEDILEEIIGYEIVDEDDSVVDMRVSVLSEPENKKI